MNKKFRIYQTISRFRKETMYDVSEKKQKATRAMIDFEKRMFVLMKKNQGLTDTEIRDLMVINKLKENGYTHEEALNIINVSKQVISQQGINAMYQKIKNMSVEDLEKEYQLYLSER